MVNQLLCLRFRTLASEIVTRIEGGEWTASEVLEAYIARAAFAHSRTNCLTEGSYLSLLV
jgi:amidase